MNAAILELLTELLGLAVFGVGAVGLSVVGAYIERFALQTVQSGQLMLGAWSLVIGVVVLYFAYLLATDKFPAKLAAVRHTLAEQS